MGDAIIINGYEILTRANQFREASEQIRNSIGKSVPLEINACFACELYMKYLINFVQKNKISTTKGDLVKVKHHLAVLYKELAEELRNTICQKMKFDIYEQLEKVGNNFIELRYDYEYDKVTYSPDFIYDLMITLSVICNQYFENQPSSFDE